MGGTILLVVGLGRGGDGSFGGKDRYKTQPPAHVEFIPPRHSDRALTFFDPGLLQCGRLSLLFPFSYLLLVSQIICTV